MRILKILLTLISIALFLLFVIFGVIIFSDESVIRWYGYVNLFLGLLTSGLGILYHLKSYRCYRKKKKVDYRRKLSKITWIGAMCYIAFITYASVLLLISYMQEGNENAAIRTEINAIITFIFMLVGLNIIEIILLEKRIKKGTIAQEQLHEIDEIGN